MNVNVYWITMHPNHYHSYLLDNIMAIPYLDVKPVYVQQKLSLYPWKSNFFRKEDAYVFKTFLGIDWKILCRILFAKRSVAIIAGWNVPTCIILISMLAGLNRKFILYSDTPNLDKVRKGIKQYLRIIWLKWIYSRMWKHFITGEVGVDALRRQGVARQKIINFPFATNVDFFVPAKRNSTNKVITLFSSGRLDIAHKGYDTVLNALGLLKVTFANLKFQYIIAGTGPDEGKIIELIEANNLVENVRLLGWVEPAGLLSFYQESDFFIHASNFDPFPNAVLEAMACGLPVIGSNLAGSVVDRVSDGVSGFIFNAGDEDHLFQQLIRALELSDFDRNNMKVACRTTALRWNVSYNVDKLGKIIKIYHRWLNICF